MADEQPRKGVLAFVKKYALWGIGAALAAALVWSLAARWYYALPDGLLAASGRIEGDEVVIAPKVAGQLTAVLKDKGEQVQPGELLARISSEQLEAQLARAQDQERYWEQQVRQTAVDLDYTAGNVQASIREAEARLAAVQSRQREAAAVNEKNRLDYERYRPLFARRVIAKRQLDEVTAAYEASRARLAAADREIAQGQAQLQQAQLLTRTVELKEAAHRAAQASRQAAAAQVREAAANVKDTYIYSPCRGVILTKHVEPGEVVNAGTPLFTMVDQDKLYLKVYVNEPDIGKIALGQEARIYVDAFPETGFAARISRVSPRAEFTPKYVETRDERVKLVFAVELRAENPEGYLKPGMPGDGVIRLKDETPWRRPR